MSKINKDEGWKAREIKRLGGAETIMRKLLQACMKDKEVAYVTKYRIITIFRNITGYGLRDAKHLLIELKIIT